MCFLCISRALYVIYNLALSPLIVYFGPKDPDEEIPELHFLLHGAELTDLTQVTQTDVKVEGTFKGELYRYSAAKSCR